MFVLYFRETEVRLPVTLFTATVLSDVHMSCLGTLLKGRFGFWGTKF